jgi:hypothetical protein
MSEANIPPKHQDSPEATPSNPSAWYEGWDTFTEDCADSPGSYLEPSAVKAESTLEVDPGSSSAEPAEPPAATVVSDPAPQQGLASPQQPATAEGMADHAPEQSFPALHMAKSDAAPREEFPDGAATPESVGDPMAGSKTADDPILNEWETVDFPNAISVDAIDRQSFYPQAVTIQDDSGWAIAPEQDVQPDAAASLPPQPVDLWTEDATPHTSVNPPVRVETIPDLAAQANTEELLSLIRELNQCNNALLDRVAELETALEQQQAAAPIAAPQEWAIAGLEDLDLPAAQQKIVQLAQELELVHQTNKRQQILVETLTGQFENSQERVAELERECARLQQYANEQSQKLIQSDNTCRDLRSRLQRQQRYTLQFKVALEKALEVAPAGATPVLGDADASQESATDWLISQAPEQALVPKASHIQPWSAQGDSRFLSKLALAATGGESLDVPEPVPEPEEDAPSAATVPGESVSLNTDAMETASATAASEELQDLTVTRPPRDAEPAQPPVSFNLKGVTSTRSPAALHLPQTDDQPSDQASPGLSDDPDALLRSLPPEVLQAGISALEDILGEFWQFSQSETGEEVDSLNTLEIDAAAAEPGTPDQAEQDIPASGSTQLGPDFWQNMARLADVSAEDVLKASVADSFDAFSDLEQESVNLVKPEGSPDQNFAGEQSSTQETPVDQPPEQLIDGLPLDNPNWPAPLVRPFRQTKKLQSLAAVDLPNFK